MPATEPLPTTPDPRAEAVVWTGMAALAVGFVMHRMWLELPAARFGESLALAGLAALAAWPLARLRRWRFASALLGVWLLALVLLTGPIPALATVLLVAGSAALGSLLTGVDRPVAAAAVGMALLAGLVGWLLPLPIHSPYAHGVFLAGLVLIRRHAVRALVDTGLRAWRAGVDDAPVAARWTLLLLGLASAAAWVPTLQYDDLAYHLALPSQLMHHGRYALDPTHQAWALFPWAADVLQGVAQVLARAEARSALNVAWLAIGAVGSWQLTAGLGGSATARWSAVALFASLPTLAALMGGMQTELPTAATALVLAGMLLASSTGRGRLYAVGALAGLLLAIKPLNLFLVLALLGWAAWRGRGTGVPRRHVAAASLVALAIAGSSHAYAWAISGNPILPLANDLFRSPYFPASAFADPRWQAPLGPLAPWRLTFETRSYVEGWNGGFGFVLVGLSGAALLALALRRTRSLAVAALVALVLPLLVLPYARYAFPGLALLLPPIVVAVHAALPPRRAAWCIALVCACNLAFQANAHWILRTAGVKRSLSTLGDDMAAKARYAPERVLNARILATRPRARVLDLHGASHAELAGAGRTVSWYAPALDAAAARADADPTGQQWAALLAREGITDIVLRPDRLTPAQSAGLSRLGAYRALTVDTVEWWAISTAPSP